MHISTKLKMTRQMETGVSRRAGACLCATQEGINHTYQDTLFDRALLALA